MGTDTKIGFISFRFAGTDGVSLEALKWVTVLERMGYACYFCGGELDIAPADRSHLVEKAHFQHPEIRELYGECFGNNHRTPAVSDQIHRFKTQLKTALYEFIARFELDFLVAENVLAIPLNIPFGLALAEVIAEFQRLYDALQ